MRSQPLEGFSYGGYLPMAVSASLAHRLLFHPKFENQDERWMFVALLEGMKGAGISCPNPSVGCVIVRDGKQISQGATERYRSRHAERVAFDRLQSKDLLQDATVYITLEPCFHEGHQPPCVDLFKNSGIRRVVIATEDPNPKTHGQSIAKLKEDGIEVSVGVLEEEAKMWHAPFFFQQKYHRPMIVAKWAESSNGFLADKDGNSKWISNDLSRSYVHWLRQKYDAIVVGAQTVLKDQPKLTVRDSRLPILRQPTRIILDPKSRLQDISQSLIETTFSTEAKTVLLIEEGHEPPKNLPKHVELNSILFGTDLKGFHNWIVKSEFQSVLIEGGPSLLSALFSLQAIDLVHRFKSSKPLSESQYQVAPPYKKGVELKIETDELREWVLR